MTVENVYLEKSNRDCRESVLAVISVFRRGVDEIFGFLWCYSSADWLLVTDSGAGTDGLPQNVSY